MEKTGLEHGRIELYLSDQLVVALPHADEVQRELTDLGAAPRPLDSDARLDLALLELGATAQAVARLEALDPGLFATVERQLEEQRNEPPSDLDLLLKGLRERFKDRYDGWVPTIGKNRVVWRVTGEYVIGGGGEDRPRPPAPGEGLSEFPPRDSHDGAGRKVCVGILDTPLAAHPWLGGTYLAEPDAMLPDPSEQLEARRWPQGHATFVAGLVVRQAPAAQLDVRLGLTGRDATADTWNVAKELVRFAQSGADVLNLSFGCFTEDDEAPLVLARAIDRLGPELVVVTAAGNHGGVEKGDVKPLTPIWPAALDDVVAVGATGPDGTQAPFSPKAPWVDLLAPGVEVLSTYLSGEVLAGAADGYGDPAPVSFPGYARWSGTSFAAAVVSGAIARETTPGRVSAREVLHGLLHPAEPPADGGKPFVPQV